MKLIKKRYIAIAMVITGVLLVLFPENFFLMLIGSFAWYIWIAFAIISAYYLLRKQYILAFGGFVSVVLIHTLFSGVFIQGGPNDMNAEGIRIAHFNVLKKNKQTAPTIQQAIACDADLISFVEVDHAWGEALEEGLCAYYPHYRIVPTEKTNGLAVFSKYPLHEDRVIVTEGHPNIVGNVCMPQDSFHFVASHTKAPTNFEFYGQRNKQIRQIANYLEQVEGPKVALGDFNAVPWDRKIVALKRDTNMSDSRKSLEATYPTWMPVRIPIDYIFHSDELQCLGFSSLEPTHSDHLGIIGVYHLNKS